MKKILLALVLGLFALNVNAQFSRVGNQASLTASYENLNPKGASAWEGIQVTNTIPLGVQENVFGQPVRFNLDIGGGYVHNNAFESNFGSYGVGLTTWLNANFDNADWSVAPYFRAGITGNNGSTLGDNNNYFGYQVEPGVVARAGNFYGLIAYNYGDGFKSNGLLQNAIGMGAGVILTKSFSIEGRYDLGYGSYDTNKYMISGVYKF